MPLITVLFRYVLLTFVDSLIAGVRKTRETLKRYLYFY